MSTIPSGPIQALQLPATPSAPSGVVGQPVPAASGGTAAPAPAAPPAVAESQAQQKSTTDDLKSAAAVLQNHVSHVAPELAFSVNNDGDEAIVTVTDPTTNTVIQQIPSEVAQQVSKGIDQFRKHHGLLLDRKA